jgi:hypothetical protein
MAAENPSRKISTSADGLVEKKFIVRCGHGCGHKLHFLDIRGDPFDLVSPSKILAGRPNHAISTLAAPILAKTPCDLRTRCGHRGAASPLSH